MLLIAVELEKHNWYSNSYRLDKNFFFSKTSRTSVGPTQPPVQWVPGFSPLGKASRAWS